MDKPFKVKVMWEEDSDWGGDVPRVELMVDEGDNKIYSVRTLSDCPEDACIARDLVDSSEIIRYIELGIQLAAEGYTSVEAEWEKVDSVY